MEFTSFPDSGIMTAAFYCILFGCESEAEAGKNADATIIVIVWLVWGRNRRSAKTSPSSTSLEYVRQANT